MADAPKPPLYSRALDYVEIPRYVTRSARIVSIVFAAVVFGLLITPWQQTSRGAGKTIAYSPTDRPQTVDAPVEGRLGKWYVQEGSHVNEGDIIVELIDNDPDILRRLQTERDAVRRRVEAAALSARTAKLNVDRQEALLEKGIVSALQVERARIDLAKHASDEAGARAEVVRIETRLSRQETQSVRAPRTGTILRRNAGEGTQLVKAGDPIATIVPETTSRAVELFVDGNDIPLVDIGRKVRIQFEGWPAVQFSGWPSIAVGTFGGVVSIIDAAEYGNGKFRILISPDPNEGPWPSAKYLRQGARAHGWILLNQVTLGYELWRQFNGFSPNVEMPMDATGSAAKEASSK